MNRLPHLSVWVLYATVFTLPMFMRVNNFLLGAFIVLTLGETLWKGRFASLGKNLIQGLPIIVFFGLAVVGAFREWNLEGFALLEKHWSLLLVPLAMLSVPQRYALRKRSVFLAFVWGCTATLIICYGHVIWNMLRAGEPLDYFYRWRYLGQQFTAVADTHPTYLAVFVVIAVFFLLQDRGTSYILKSILIPFLVLGLFQLASRIALFLCVLLLLFLLIQRIRKSNWQLASLVFGLVFGSLLVTYYGSDYLNRRIFSTAVIKDERRLARWEVSYEIFKAHPVLGVGYKQIKPMRNAGYLEKGLKGAAAEEDNAHNQFLEYLSTQGAVGGFVYGLSMMYLFLLAIYRRDVLFGFVFFAFLIASSTESMLVRIKGIEYLAVFGTLFICTVYSQNQKPESKVRLE